MTAEKSSRGLVEEALKQAKERGWIGGQRQVIELLINFIDRDENPQALNGFVDPSYQLLVSKIRALKKR